MNKIKTMYFIFLSFLIVNGCATALDKAARNNDVNKIALLLQQGRLIDELNDNEFGYTALHYAAANGKMKALESLLDKGADINSRGRWNQTALHAACGLSTPVRPGEGSSEAAIFLINRGADASIVDVFSRTPMHYASARGRLDVIKVLLDKGVDINIGNGVIGTPLHSAFNPFRSETQLKTAEFLLKNGADINATSSNGWTPLHQIAKAFCECEWVKFLIEHGADVNKPDKNGETPLSIIKNLCPEVNLGESFIKKQ
jgi:ankyrin repeat protein